MTRTRLLAPLLALGLLLPACSSTDSGSPDPSATSDGSAPGASSDAGVEEFDPEQALVEQTVALPSSPEDEVTLGVLSLEVKDEVMLLRMAVTPTFASESDSRAINLFSSLDDTGFRPVLVDVENLKEYAVLKDTSGHRRWASDEIGTKARNGTPMLAYAYFAAPEDDIDTIDLKVTDFWPTFTDVAISR